MASEEMKMAVAQNCPGYHPRYLYSQLFSGLSMGTSTESCSNCQNYTRGKCQKNLFNEIKEKIEVN